MTSIDPFSLTGFESSQNYALNIPLFFTVVDVATGLTIGWSAVVSIVIGVLVFTVPETLGKSLIIGSFGDTLLLILAILI